MSNNLRSVVPKLEVLLLKKKSSSMKQAMRDMSDKAFKSVCM
jgi:hypothetical protein